MSDELKFTSVIDEDNHEYFIEKKLGEGGQGAVFKIKGQNLVCKVLLDNNGNVLQDNAKYKEFRSNLEEVKVLNLPASIHISRPEYFLKKPYCGYIMELMDGMISLNDIIIPNDGEKISEFYKRTGGLLRRIKILRTIAGILETLARESIVYADLSPNNIYISEDIHEAEVWIIDSDNMRYTIDFSKSICTPSYAAPEIFSGRRNNDYFSDSYSFAIIAFQFLTIAHPFIGDAVLNPSKEDNDEDDWGDVGDNNDVYSRAYKGEFPWILDENDKSNHFNIDYFPENFIPYTKELYNLFDKTFSYEAINTPNIRPKMYEWYEALSNALNLIIECDCENSYIKTKEINHCPFCKKERNKVYVLRSYKSYKPNILKSFIYEDNNISKDESLKSLININNDIIKKTRKRKILKNINIKEREIITYSDITVKKFLDDITADVFYIDVINENEYHIINKTQYPLYIIEPIRNTINDSIVIDSINNIKLVLDENEVSFFMFEIKLM